LSDRVTPAEALTAARRMNWLPPKVKTDKAVTWGGMAFLMMKSFNLSGGIMYTLFPGPRTSYREMIYRRYIQGLSDSGKPVTGDQLLQVLGRVLDASGDGESPELAK
jgi:hypothetical protein